MKHDIVIEGGGCNDGICSVKMWCNVCKIDVPVETHWASGRDEWASVGDVVVAANAHMNANP